MRLAARVQQGRISCPFDGSTLSTRKAQLSNSRIYADLEIVKTGLLCPFPDQKIRAAPASRKLSRGGSCFGNKRIAPCPMGRSVIAIFCQHSTPFQSGTIILTSRDRASSRAWSSGDCLQ
jgi:hypothetical protein